MKNRKKLDESFFSRKTKIVAKELLGKILVRKFKGKELKAKIVETEAYYGSNDPASRAFKRTKMSEPMFAKAGTLFIYNVHKYLMFNIVTEKENKPGAVLIRALEPMNFKANLSGPGRLTRALKITKELNGKHLSETETIAILNSETDEKIKIVSSHRIGVTHDLKKKLRFFIKGNPYVSK